jgi:hypothetical protein
MGYRVGSAHQKRGAGEFSPARVIGVSPFFLNSPKIGGYRGLNPRS